MIKTLKRGVKLEAYNTPVEGKKAVDVLSIRQIVACLWDKFNYFKKWVI